ncbi:MAG TPA: regulatory protein RecX [Anaeromyxobacteraceae bacterium]|nr:regulatory protein RecX [Anaeromyxobacteraceae bacterium]
MEESPQARARARALRLLAARPRTEAQIRERLARAGFEAEAAGVVAWLRDLRYLDDGAYARDRAASLVGGGRLGPRLAEQRLVAAGIPRDAARRAVREALGDDEVARCRELAERRTRGDPRALDDKSRARLSRWLLGRGFSGRAVSSALGVYVDDAEDR